MNVSQLTSIQELKALAYDQIRLQEQIQHNLAIITARIAELEAQTISSHLVTEE
jgi:hypothetical protein